LILDFFRWLGWLPVRQSKIKPSDVPVIKDPFAVIPVRPDRVEVKTDSRGNIHLRLDATPDGSIGRIARRYGQDYSRKLELDRYGTEYYSHIDGETPLGTIIDRMARKFKKKRRQLESNVMLFTRKLMQMNFIVLKIPVDKETVDKEPTAVETVPEEATDKDVSLSQ
jgi:hypothetical protein